MTNSRLIYTFPNWDEVPGMLSGSDKRISDTKRLLWLELVKNAEGIRALFIIGPGNKEDRCHLLQALIDSEADTGWQKSTAKMAGEYSTLGSVWLLRDKADEYGLEDLEKLAPAALNTLETFLADQLPKIDAGIMAMKS